MYKYIYIPKLTCDHYCPDEKTTLTYVSGDGRSIRDGWSMYGAIGTTACCGSASVVGLRFDSETIAKFLKDSKCSVIILNGQWASHWDKPNLTEIESQLNYMVPKVFQCKLTLLNNTQILIVLDILDPIAYLKWMDKK